MPRVTSSILPAPPIVQRQAIATATAQSAREAGDIFSIRADELALFLISAQEARLAALEAAA